MTPSLRIISLLSLVIINSAVSFAQVKYQENYENALKMASKKQRLVFVYVSFPASQNVPAIYAPDKKAAKYYNSNFINYRVEYMSAEGAKLRQKYGLTALPSFLFLKPDGTLILKAKIVPHDPSFFVNLALEANQLLENKTRLIDYDDRYKNNKNIDRQFLKDYITLRERSGIFSNADLIEEYMDFLTISELSSYEEVLFIHQAGPIIFSRAYNFANSNRKIVDSIYKYAPLQDRIDINNRIIVNSKAKAIATKNRKMAISLSNFVRNTWKTNPKEGSKRSNKILLEFYKATNDTILYYNLAPRYYDQYYMSVSVDSIKNMVKLNLSKLDTSKMAGEEFTKGGKVYKRYSAISTMTSSEINILNIAPMLNNAAWDFYTMGTRNPLFLNKALLWSRRSIEIDPKAAYYDTLAHLFYRLGWHNEAELNQNKAIALAEQQNVMSKEEIDILRKKAEKMKNKTL